MFGMIPYGVLRCQTSAMSAVNWSSGMPIVAHSYMSGAWRFWLLVATHLQAEVLLLALNRQVPVAYMCSSMLHKIGWKHQKHVALQASLSKSKS